MRYHELVVFLQLRMMVILKTTLLKVMQKCKIQGLANLVVAMMKACWFSLKAFWRVNILVGFLTFLL